jgi:hypothetical protein
MALKKGPGGVAHPAFGFLRQRREKQWPSPVPIDLRQSGQGGVADNRVLVGGEVGERTRNEPPAASRQGPGNGATDIRVTVTQQAREAPRNPATRNVNQGFGRAGADVAIGRT